MDRILTKRELHDALRTSGRRCGRRNAVHTPLYWSTIPRSDTLALQYEVFSDKAWPGTSSGLPRDYGVITGGYGNRAMGLLGKELGWVSVQPSSHTRLGGRIILVGVARFELTTSASRTRRATPALHPEWP